MFDMLRRFYRKVFVGIYMQEHIVHVGVLSVGSDGRERAYEQRSFGSDGLSEEVLRYLQDAMSATPCAYVAVTTDTEACGAVATCSLSKAKELVPQIETAKTVCIDEEWMNYLDEGALHAVLSRFETIEPDAVYTPFVPLHACFLEKMRRKTHALYVLLTPEAMSLAAVKEGHLRFAEQVRCSQGPMIPAMVDRIVAILEAYYGKPCCRGEFVEAVHIADAAGTGALLSQAIDERLLIEAEVEAVDLCRLTASACMQEVADGL